MIVNLVMVDVKPEYVDDFIAATTKNHNASIKEPGNMRFDVLQSTPTPTQFVLYEAYESESAAAEHKKTKHYLEWRETVEKWMAKPRTGISHKVICPRDKSRW